MKPSFAQLNAHVEEAEIKKKNCISLVFRHQGPYEIKLNPKGISNVGYFCQSILVQKCSFREYSAVYSKVLSVHAKIQDNPMLLASTENVLSCTKSKCVLIQKVFRRIQTC